MIIVTVPLTSPSLNLFYAGTHWTKRKKVVDEWHKAIRVLCKQKKIKVERYPVKITTRSFFKSRQKRDCSNCFVANKLGEDGLVKAGVLFGDGPDYVSCHEVLPPVFGAAEDCTLIKIEEV